MACVVTIDDLTDTTVGGIGVFDKLMTAVEAHIIQEYDKNRIRGPEYSTVYLGALQSTISQSIEFMVQTEQIALLCKQQDLLVQQALLAAKQILVADGEIAQQAAVLTRTAAETALLTSQEAKIQAEILNEVKQGVVLDNQATDIAAATTLKGAQTTLSGSQNLQVIAETLNVPKQGALIDAQELSVDAETALKTAQTTLSGSQNLQVVAETLNIPKQGALLDSQLTGMDQDNLTKIQETANAVTQNDVIFATKCKLEAEFDLLVLQQGKVTAETGLLTQKKATETAQISNSGVDAASVIGKQNALYAAQTKGYGEDSKQKAAKIMLDTWNVQRTTNDQTPPPSSLGDSGLNSIVATLIADL